MITQNVLNVTIAPLEDQLQRITEDFAVHLKFANGDPAVVASCHEIVDQARKRLVALRHEVEAITLDPDTSDIKKVKLAGKAVSQAYTDLQLVRKKATTIADAAAEAKRQLTAVPKSQHNETTDYLIGYEIRTRLISMTQSERMTLFAQAVATKNIAVQRALANDPLNEELIPREYVERVIQEHAQQTEGRAWTRLESLQLVSDRLTMIAVGLDLSLKNYGTLPVLEGKPVRHVDLKQVNPQDPPDNGPADQLPAGGITSLK